MDSRQLLTFFLLTIMLHVRADEKVTLSLYYETLCPNCADFIVNHLAKVFQNGLVSILNLRLLPWGNAFVNYDGSVLCQHGPDECLLNTIEACTITIYPDLDRHFSFIYCVERLTLEGRHSEWTSCFELTRLGTAPIDCYRNGFGNQIEQSYASETGLLNPPHRFVPWVVVNNQALQEDFQNFAAYVCKAYKGTAVPEACTSFSLENINNSSQKANPMIPVCYADEGKNMTSVKPTNKIPRLVEDSWTDPMKVKP